MNWLATQTMIQTIAQLSVGRILNALPEGLLIAFFAWILLRVLRKQSSGTRFAVWFVALLMVAVLPLLGGFNVGADKGRTWPALGMAQGHLHSAITIPGSWALFVFVAWALGAGVAMARLASGLWQLRQLRRSCTAVAAADLDPIVQRTLEGLSASGAVRVGTSEEVRVPSALGFWKRTIVLPAWTLRELSPEDLNVILLHEFAHLRRADDWTNLIQKIVRAIFFFHPAVWWIESHLAVEREMACDDAVLAQTSNPRGYATCLVSLLEKSLAHGLTEKGPADQRWSMAQAAVHRASEAALRLARILDSNRPSATRVWKPALAMVAVFSVLCLAAFPHAPQFVAFDQDMQANVDHVYTAADGQTGSQALPSQFPSQLRSMTGVAVIPTRASTARTHAVARRQSAPAPAVAARFNAEPMPAQVVQVSASADPQLVPQFQTLVFVEATQWGGSDSPVWSVQVWRVTFVSAVQQRVVSVPVASSI